MAAVPLERDTGDAGESGPGVVTWFRKHRSATPHTGVNEVDGGRGERGQRREQHIHDAEHGANAVARAAISSSEAS